MDNDMMGFAAHTERLDRITNEIRSNAERGVTRSSVSVPDSISSSDIEYIRRSLARSGIDACSRAPHAREAAAVTRAAIYFISDTDYLRENDNGVLQSGN